MEGNCIGREECKACQELYNEINNSQNRRIDTLEESIKQMYSLTVSVEKMAICLDQNTKELIKQGERLTAIEKEPAAKWKQITSIVLTVIVTAVATYFVSKLGI